MRDVRAAVLAVSVIAGNVTAAAPLCPIDAITAPRRKPVSTAIAQAVDEVAVRGPLTLELDFSSRIRSLPARADALMRRANALIRIVREAAANAARHRGAARVSPSLQGQGWDVRLRVSDNGSGFATGAQPYGFGPASMRDCATSAGDVRVSSVPGHGGEVEVRL